MPIIKAIPNEVALALGLLTKTLFGKKLTIMTEIFSPLPSQDSKRILCCYVNATNQIQIARIANISNWYFERVVFPGQRLLFEAFSNAELEIHTCVVPGATLSDKLLCERLQIYERISYV